MSPHLDQVCKPKKHYCTESLASPQLIPYQWKPQPTYILDHIYVCRRVIDAKYLLNASRYDEILFFFLPLERTSSQVPSGNFLSDLAVAVNRGIIQLYEFRPRQGRYQFQLFVLPQLPLVQLPQFPLVQLPQPLLVQLPLG